MECNSVEYGVSSKKWVGFYGYRQRNIVYEILIIARGSLSSDINTFRLWILLGYECYTESLYMGHEPHIINQANKTLELSYLGVRYSITGGICSFTYN